MSWSRLAYLLFLAVLRVLNSRVTDRMMVLSQVVPPGVVNGLVNAQALL